MLAAIPTSVKAQGGACGELNTANRLGDYVDPAHADYLKVVQGGHFNSDVENLVRGLSTADPMGDIRYTLRRFPNHHRALNAMSRYYYLHLNSYLRDGYTSPDCYFGWAMQFRPNDGMVALLYAIHLHRGKRTDDALLQYQTAIELAPNSAEAHYNFGLLYVDIGDTTRARDQAISAYQLGYPLQGLKDRLRRENVWTAADDKMLMDLATPAQQ